MTSRRSTFARAIIAAAFALLVATATAQIDTTGNWLPREVAWAMANDMDGVLIDVCPGTREKGVPEPACFIITRGTFGTKALLDDFAYRMGDFTWIGTWDSLGNVLGRSAYATNDRGGRDPFYIMIMPHLTDFAMVFVMEGM